MIEEAGKVLAKEASGRVWVSTMRQSACDSCSAKAGCGQSTLSKLLSPEANHVLAIDPVGVEVGDQVVLGIPENIVVKSSLIMYLLPLLLLLLGAVSFGGFAPGLSLSQDLLAALGGVVGFLLGLSIVFLHGKKNQHNEAYQAVVLREQKLPGHTPISIE